MMTRRRLLLVPVWYELSAALLLTLLQTSSRASRWTIFRARFVGWELLLLKRSVLSSRCLVVYAERIVKARHPSRGLLSSQ
jgi:hypothetical protein